MIESVTERGWHVETVILSQSEPSDLAGRPSSRRPVTWCSPHRRGQASRRPRRAVDLLLRRVQHRPAVPAGSCVAHPHAWAGRQSAIAGFGDVRRRRQPGRCGCRRLGSGRAHRITLRTSGLRDVRRGVRTGFGDRPVARAADVGVAGRFPGCGRTGDGVGRGLPAARRNQLSVIPKDHASRSRAFPTPRT